MGKSSKRAERRYNKIRLGIKNYHNYRHWFGAYQFGDTRVRCSDICCGNPRKWYKELTMQERRHIDTAYQISRDNIM